MTIADRGIRVHHDQIRLKRQPGTFFAGHADPRGFVAHLFEFTMNAVVSRIFKIEKQDAMTGPG
ncbi:hypothetical protein [Sphingomonas sp. PP-CC-3G-468]|uniref:hypothetical protein n=1 Tax=Sphingomonas sp. PP-CC-3G-468 TaxID=2135656 RepID=UPI001A9EADB3|nr:hypothetical protein [Sphingomonas sp. PP-CC-3G-468]